MIVSHLLLILHKKRLKCEMWQKVAKFKGAEYFRKALYFLSVFRTPGAAVGERKLTRHSACPLAGRFMLGC